MTERPILFSAPMVLALLAGTKTQTRRILKAQTAHRPIGWGLMENGTGPGVSLRCPYGQPGDRLWVRENFAIVNGGAFYAADGAWPAAYPKAKWKPSIHMPRWASRISLEVTAVRVERLQDISEADAIAEGIASKPFRFDDGHPILTGYVFDATSSDPVHYPTAKEAYLAGWDTINGDRAPAKSNPWVWVVEFRRSAP